MIMINGLDPALGECHTLHSEGIVYRIQGDIFF